MSGLGVEVPSMAVEEKYIAKLVEAQSRGSLYLKQLDRARVHNSGASKDAMQSWS